jgi:predicted nucleic acid-binding protein
LLITAIDSNVLLDILIPNEAFADAATASIEDAASSGSLVVSDIVYSEICIQFGTQRECDNFFHSNEIRVEPLNRSAHFLASRIWREYRARGGKRDRILPDFLIGAHAQVQAKRLISRDRGFYRTLFPKLRLIDPASPV